MKKGIRRGIIGLTALAALAGCGESVSSGNLAGPEETTKVTNVQDAERRLRNYSRGDVELESKINDAISHIMASPKVAQEATLIEVPYNGINPGDFDYDHDIDFDDFFGFADNFGTSNENYDLDGDGGIVDFDDFFRFADNFGKRVNFLPFVTGLTSDNGDNVEKGSEVTLNANALDREGDKLNYNWFHNDEPAGVNGRELVRCLETLGEHVFSVKAVDEYGGESNLVSKSFLVRDSGPKLSLPTRFQFSQWTPGNSWCNTGNFDLDEYVSDPNFRDDELSWSYKVEGDNSFYHEGRDWFRNYRAKALHLEDLGDRVLEINPIANYNASDHGVRTVKFKVSNPDGKADSAYVDVNVVRSNEFDELYDDVVTGNGWEEPPTKFYIWTGQGVSEDESQWPLTEATGPRPTQQEIDYFYDLARLIPTVSDFFVPLEIIETEDWNEWMANEKGSILAYIDNYAMGDNTWDYNKRYYETIHIGMNSVPKHEARLRSFWSVCIHGMFDHGMGPYHPKNDREELFYETVFSGGNRLEYVPDRDKAVIDSFYETRQY
ncbi:MAG: hypothetical protein KKG75_00335 [Nanoarchaeota archaeon]|nr:hypothetical protein [Nanoarchaeota archaeon]